MYSGDVDVSLKFFIHHILSFNCDDIKMKRISALLLPLLLIIFILIVSYARFTNRETIWRDSFANGDLIFVLLYILWILLEIRISLRDAKEEKGSSDFGTRELYALGQALTILSALWFNSVWSKPLIYHGVGIAIFIAGVGFRWWAIRSLDIYYSHMVRMTDDHRIIDTGPYRFVRHPAYAGMLAAHVGVICYFFNYVSLCIFLFVFLPAIILRIHIEEKALFTIEGYDEFARIRKRLIPPIW
jgi:protein-S-isoprenylcysteine O-methyltransferase Ste14